MDSKNRHGFMILEFGQRQSWSYFIRNTENLWKSLKGLEIPLIIVSTNGD